MLDIWSKTLRKTTLTFQVIVLYTVYVCFIMNHSLDLSCSWFYPVNFLFPFLRLELVFFLLFVLLFAFRFNPFLLTRFWDHLFSTCKKSSEKLILNPWHTYIRRCADQGVRNVSFSEHLAYAIDEWSLS